MSAALILHAFEGADIRITDLNGDPWFIASDCAKLLGHGEAKDLTRSLDDDEKGSAVVPTLGGYQKVSIVSEPGLMRAIAMRRVTGGLDPDIAERVVRFQRWLYHGVLPSIRRTGSYQAEALSNPSKPMTARDVHSTFKAWHGMAKTIGLDGNVALIAANQATVKQTGVDPLAILGQTHLIAEKQDELLTATQIGERIGGLSGRAVNQRLADQGFHEHHESGWVPTEKGQPFGLWQDTSKRQGDGTPIRQWKWFGSVVNSVRDGPSLILLQPDPEVRPS